jgi:hypothetical protein
MQVTRCPRCQRRFSRDGACERHGAPTASRAAVGTDHDHVVVAPRGWELAGEIATGASSIVMRLRGKRERVAALKFGRWQHPDLRARFAMEAAALRAIGSPTTPTLIDDGVIDGWPYLVMEYIPGETLASWMIDPRRASHVGKIIAVLVQLADTLSRVHEAGFVHRDLKPENVMIGERPPCILDLGLACRPRELDATSIADVVGTVHYLAPEQIRPGDAVDQRADLYSFGVIAFELMAGIPPFVGERRAIEYQHQFVRPPRVSQIRSLPRALDELIAQCTSKQPEARPQTAGEIARRLREIFAELRTLPGVGPAHDVAANVVATEERVAILWIDSHHSSTAASVIAEYHGHLVRRTADGIVAVFAASELEQPVLVAHAAAKELAATHCVIMHVATAVVRHPTNGAVAAYGEAIEAAETWSSSSRELGVTLTDAATRELGQRAAGLPPRALVGRDETIDAILDLVARTPSRLISLWGGAGRGKSRVLHEVAQRLRLQRREVIHVRAWHGFLGELGDDARVLAQFDPTAVDPLDALRSAAARRAIVIIDDVQWLSSAFLRALVRPGLPGVRLVSSPTSMFATTAGAVAHTAIELGPLTNDNAAMLLREVLQPAELLPLVLVERLTIRGIGNPRLLLALARELRRRGAIRRTPAGLDWYVADDELDTLLEPPDPEWLAARILEHVSTELEPILRMCAGLGPSFGVAEVTAVTGAGEAPAHVESLCQAGVLEHRGDAYRFANAEIQAAIYDHVLDTRALVHDRALAFALAQPDTDHTRWLARLAFHASGCGDDAIATACYVALADEARDEPTIVAALLERGRRAATAIVPPALAAMITRRR